MAERAGLENRILRKRDGGSNPSLSETPALRGFNGSRFTVQRLKNPNALTSSLNIVVLSDFNRQTPNREPQYSLSIPRQKVAIHKIKRKICGISIDTYRRFPVSSSTVKEG